MSASDIPPLAGEVVELEPLTEHHARELVSLFDDSSLHRFTGGEPLSLEELEDRYRRLEEGAPMGSGETWLNWVVRDRRRGSAVGTAQVTISGEVARLAWVVGAKFQRRGYATEAARLLADLARDRELIPTAHIHPEHVVSERVAERAGLSPTSRWEDDERIWEG